MNLLLVCKTGLGSFREDSYISAEGGSNMFMSSEETHRRGDAMAVHRAFASTRKVCGFSDLCFYLGVYLLRN